MAEPTTVEVEIEVRYAETDQMGVVHHANYLIWFELARTRLCTRSGFRYADIEKQGYLIMVIGADVEYRRGARYGDPVTVTATLIRMTSRTLEFGYVVRSGDSLLARGTTTHVWVHADSGRPCRIPDVMQPPFAELAGG